MRIGINCIESIPGYSGGVNSYTQGLLKGFSQLDTKHTFQVYTTNRNYDLFRHLEEIPNFKVFVFNHSFFAKKLSSVFTRTTSTALHKLGRDVIFRKMTSVMDENSDVIYTPNTTLFTYNHKRPTVLSMHDIQQVHFPQFFSKEELWYRKMAYGLSAKSADYIQASSSFIHNDFVSHFSFLKEEQVPVIPEGVNIETFQQPVDKKKVIEKYSLPARFLFYPAQLWHHKNHLFILKALKEIKLTKNLEIPLVLTGSAYSSSNFVQDFIHEHQLNQVLYLGKVPFEDLLGLYHTASFLIHASLHESSCLPVLEAAAAGLPIIASNIEPNVEMGQVLRMNLFDPVQLPSLIKLLPEIWTNERLAQEQAVWNLQHVHQYSWKNAAVKYVQFFEKIVK